MFESPQDSRHNPDTSQVESKGDRYSSSGKKGTKRSREGVSTEERKDASVDKGLQAGRAG